MLKALHRGARQPRRRHRRRRPADACRCYGCAGRRRRAARATIRPRRSSSSRTRLNKPGSEKETWHIEFDLAGSGLDYTVGDAFGLFPTNDPALADAVIAALGAPPDFPIGGTHAARGADRRRRRSAPAPDMLFQLISYITGGERRQKAKALADGRGPRRRRRHARRAGGAREIPRRPARSGSLHRGAGAAAAAALFDLVLAQGRSRPACR